MLYEPDVHLYLLDTQGRVLASSGDTGIATDFTACRWRPCAIALDPKPMTYIMGHRPDQPHRPAIVAARAWSNSHPAGRQCRRLPVPGVPARMPFSRDRVATLLGTLAQPGLMMILLLVVGMADCWPCG